MQVTFLLVVLAALAAAAVVWALHAERRAAVVQAQLEAERRGTADTLAALDEARKGLRDSFAALSLEALRQNNESFLQLARTSLEQVQERSKTDLDARQKEITALVQPLNDTLGRLGEHLRESDKERSALTGQMRSVAQTQELLRQQTTTLVSALKSPNQRGRWGEVQLRTVLERAGMLPYCDFIEKDSTADGDGRRLTPDVRVLLPNEASIVIDSKVPIDAYLHWTEADETVREPLLRDHARQVREHIRGLAGKSYWARFEPSPDFVVMFVPAEPLFNVALQKDPTLFDYAMDQRVIPASPLTLVALLRTIASAWQQHRLTQNAEEVQALGKELYERLCTMAEHVADVGDHLRKAGASYDQFVGSLDARVLASARRFKDLGIHAAKDLSPDLPPIRLETREPRTPELRVPLQESLIDAELVVDVVEAKPA
ncbi:MAG TPA: DNA recombination protein RmuC [Vicinamibacterales bacterium]